jgi:hypothetical protein
MGIFRGQGATEYLVLLAVVLIVALVSVALLGFFPGMAGDARITQSQSYWRGQANPVAILDASVFLTTATLSLQNKGATQITMTNFTVAGLSNNTSVSFGAGESKTVTVTGLTSCAAGTVFDQAVVIKYTGSSGITNIQTGAKNLVLKCA